MKIIKLMLVVLLVGVCFLTACEKEIVPDYSEVTEFEAALNQGEDLTGKTVKFTVSVIVPQSAFGYNMQTGEHLNFVSTENPKISVGDEIIVKVTKVSSILGSYIISYELVKK